MSYLLRVVLVLFLLITFPLTAWAQDQIENGYDEEVEADIEDIWLDADFSGTVYDLSTVGYTLPFAIGDVINGTILISGKPFTCIAPDPNIPWEYILTFYDQDPPTINIKTSTDPEDPGYDLLQYPGWPNAFFEPFWVRITFMDVPGMTEFRERVWISISWGYRTQEEMGPGTEFGYGSIALAPPSLPGLPALPQELFASWGLYDSSLDVQDWAVKMDLNRFPWWHCNSGIFCDQKAGQNPCTMCTGCK